MLSESICECMLSESVHYSTIATAQSGDRDYIPHGEPSRDAR